MRDTSALRWQGAKAHPNQFGAWKTHPSKDSSQIVERPAEYYRKPLPESVDTKFGYDSDMVKPYEPKETDEPQASS
jgi:hypothetical protein